jgi:hypothetical protein
VDEGTEAPEQQGAFPGHEGGVGLNQAQRDQGSVTVPSRPCSQPFLSLG